MKKLLLNLLLLIPFMTVSAAECSLIFSELGLENATQVTTVTINEDISLTVDKADGSTAPAYYTTGDALRLYAKNTLTVTAAEGVTITGATIAYPTGNPVNSESTVNVGDLTIGADAATWEGEAQSFTLTQGGTKGHARITSITVTYTVSQAPTVAMVKYSVAPGQVLPETKVELSCSTEGAEIHYTINGETPTPNSDVYSAPIVITEDLTIKAIAVLDGITSEVSEAAYTVIKTYTSLSEILALPKNTAYVCGLPLTVYESLGAYVYVYDPVTDEFGLIYKFNLGLQKGDVIKAGWQGTVAEYGGLPQLVPDETILALTGEAGATPWVMEVNAVDVEYVLTADNVRKPYILKGVKMKDAYNKKNGYGLMGENEINLYNQFNIDVANIAAGDVYDIYGILNSYNGTIQVNPVTFDTPSFPLIATPENLTSVEEITTVYVNGDISGEKAAVELNEACEGTITLSDHWGAAVEGYILQSTIEDVEGLSTLVINVAPTITEYGVYIIDIPEGYLKVANGYNEQAYIQYVIEEPIEPVELTLDPAPGTYEAMPVITICADGIDEARAADDEQNITITDAAGQVVYEISAFDLNNNCYNYETWEFAGYKLEANITEPGIYTVNIPEGYFEFSNMARSLALTAEYTIEAEAPAPELLYSSIGDVTPSEGWGNTTVPVIRDIVVDVYEDFVILKGFAGIEGYDLKVGLGANDAITYLASIVDGVEGKAYTEGYANIPTGRDDVTEIKYYLGSRYCYGGLYEEESGYFIGYCYWGEDWTYYYCAWPQGEDEGEWVNPFETPATLLYSTTGATESVEEDADNEDGYGKSLFPKVANIDIDVYNTYIYIKNIAGVAGYGAKVAYNSDEEVLSIMPVTDGEDGSPCKQYTYLNTGLSTVETLQPYCDYSYAASYDDKSGYVLLGAYFWGDSSVDGEFSYYYLVWKGNTTSITNITVKAGQTVYFDLQGRIIDQPAAGTVCIRVIDGKASKVIVK